MNSDDPKLTAYALDELDPAERAEIEQLLRENPDALAEVEETKTFVAQLRHELKAEAGAPLTEEQKATVLAAAETPAAPFAIDLVAPPQSGRWMHRWMPIAAGIAIVASIAALTVNPLVQQKSARRGSDMLPSLSSSKDAKPFQMLEPELVRLDVVSTAPDPATPFLDPQSALIAANKSNSGNLGLSAEKLLAPKGTPAPETVRMYAMSKSNPSPNDGLTITKSGSGTMILSGGNIGNTSTAMPAEMPASGAVAGRAPARPAAALLPAKPNAAPVYIRGQAGAAGEPVPADFSKMVAGAKPFAYAPGTPDPSGSSAIRPSPLAPEPPDSPTTASTEAYDAITDNAFLAVRENPLSTFSIDVDTASYANVRRFLNAQTRPPTGAVRIEELLNYFTYDYPQPDGDAPFSSTMEVATCPWAPEHRLVRIGLKGRDIAKDKRPASNLVFLIDVSGSMQPENKLPLLKRCLAMLVDQLTPEDTVSIAVYAGASGTVLEPSHNRAEIRAALDRLESGGSTNGAAGIQLAYRLAEKSFIKGGVNRVILATDGDFNVGVTSQSELTDLITRKAKKGTFLTVLGFGMGNLKDSTLEKLADKGNGNYAYIDTLNEGRKVLVEQINGTLVTIAKDVKIQVEFNPAQVGAYRLIGYENRLLAKEDFNDDKKDAGEIGAGHTVTALYEVVPAGQAAPGVPSVDPLKYQGTDPKAPQLEGRLGPAAASPELLTLKLRYKQPDGDVSKLLEFPLTDRGETWEKSSRDFRFAASVVGFGMLLRDSAHKGTATWDTVRELAMEGRGEDRSGYRGEFLTLLDKAKALGR